jgi:hypothetical protein
VRIADISKDYTLNYYQMLCQIQDDYIKGKISKEEYEQKSEIERLKFIGFLKEENLKLAKDMLLQAQMRELIENVGAKIEMHKSYKSIKRPTQSWCYVEGE